MDDVMNECSTLDDGLRIIDVNFDEIKVNWSWRPLSGLVKRCCDCRIVYIYVCIWICNMRITRGT